MRQIALVTFLMLVSLANANSQTAEDLALAWDKEHISKIFPSDVRHADLKAYLDQLKKLGIKVEQVGVSNASREIFQVEWGKGPLKVFMWSQMHGDEPTATSALIDLFAFLRKNAGVDWVKRIGETMTIRAVPMLNPDGAEIYQRRNLQQIDINRDAIDLKTPEARLLKQLRDDWMPAIGFNLHNQGALTTVGRTTNQAAISLLVVYGDEAKTPSFGHERNTRLAAAIAAALGHFIPGNLARYSDEWTPNAFGDNFSAWDTPTILIETGALHGKDEMFLVKMNFVAFLTAFHALASGSERSQDMSRYLMLPENTSGGLVNFIFRRAGIVVISDQTAVTTTPAVTPTPVVTITQADVGGVVNRRRASFAAPVTITGVGDLGSKRGLVEYDASGFNVVHRFSKIRAGELLELMFYRKERVVDWTVADLEKQFPPDAIFSSGKWFKGEKIVPTR
ncbi:MAG TPA: M14 family zinc carboxypeptidase [Pyrinomonadaceae bacterium]|nr:M14 family zinc carboxypeptidase [Pyrinomonadaceae bacterium]